MAVSYAVRLRLGVGGAALDSRLPSPQEEKPHRPIDPIRARLNGCSAPPRVVGRGRITRQHHGYPASRPDFFIATKIEVGNATVTERPKQALGFTVTCNANSLTKRPKTADVFTVAATLIPLQSTPKRATDLPSYMTLIPLQSGPKRAIALPFHETLIPFQTDGL